MKKTYYLIIGNGIAGYQGAKAIRKKDKENDITIVGKEKYRTYRRTQLSHALANNQEIDDLYVEDKDEFNELNIEEISGSMVEKIDVENNKVLLDNGLEISYEKLLIAIGAESFIPPYERMEGARVYKLRSYDDLNLLRRELKDINELVVSGGGLLGLELAHALLKQGKKVHVVELGENILNKQLDKKTSERLEDDLGELGLHIHTNRSIKKAFKDRVLLNDGEEIRADALIFSVGIRPNLTIIPEEIESNRAIIVDRSLKTNIDNIWSCGDCIEIDGKGFGLWSISNEMGKIAGSNMAGDDLKYSHKAPFTNLNLGDIKIYSTGKITDDSIKYENGPNEKTLFFEDNILVGGILYGDIKEMGKLNKAIKTSTRKEEIE